MEFPDLGEHCSEKSCNRLDFLPMKCDACSHVFCKDHILYCHHSCENAYKKDVQVPVCPLCNKPVPSKRGEAPDIAVGQHIDADCSSQSAVNKRKVYMNKCSFKGCKKKELVPIMCNLCRRNYCLTHRHAVDHKCAEISGPRRKPSPSGSANFANVQPTNSKQSSFKKFFKHGPASSAPKQPRQPMSSLQAGMSEDEALSIALQASMVDTNHVAAAPQNLQEEEDRLLAEALAASERSYQRVTPKDDKRCLIS